jgi:hypothetical protein
MPPRARTGGNDQADGTVDDPVATSPQQGLSAVPHESVAAPSPQAAAVVGIAAESPRSVMTVETVGLQLGDGSPISLDEVLGEARTSTIQVKQNVYESYILPGSDPRNPRYGQRLKYRAGRNVPLSEIRREQARERLRQAPETKEGLQAAPENKGPGDIEVK